MKFESDIPYVIMVVGVNGVGKTTTIGKLAHKFKKAGLKVVLGAADTFRAAAVDQLVIWSERVGVDIVKQKMGSDPASVAYKAIDEAINNNFDQSSSFSNICDRDFMGLIWARRVSRRLQVVRLRLAVTFL